MTKKQDALLLLRTHLLDMPEMVSVPVVTQNRPGATTEAQIWCRETFQHGGTSVYDGVCERVEGIYRLDFFSPVGTGMETVDSLVSKVKERFPPRTIGDGTNAVTVFRNEELTSLTQETATQTPLLIYFRYFTTL